MCPLCHHPHLDYLDEEPCVSCGCTGPIAMSDEYKKQLQSQFLMRDDGRRPPLIVAVPVMDEYGNAIVLNSGDTLSITTRVTISPAAR